MRYTLLYTLALLSALLLWGCQPDARDNGGAGRVDTLRVDTVCPLFLHYDRPACHLSIDLEVPHGATPDLTAGIARLISDLAADVSEDATPGDDLASMTSTMVKTYVDRYMAEGSEASVNYDGDVTAAASWMNYEQTLRGRVTLREADLMVYEVEGNSYEGGAHGIRSLAYGVVDLTTGSALRLADIFSDIALPSVASLLTDRLLADQGATSLQQLVSRGTLLSDAMIEPTDNFRLDTKGIEWVYNPYTIAPYSSGIIRIMLPWQQVQDYVDSRSPVMRLVRLADQTPDR